MKKILSAIAVMMVCMLLVLSLAACGAKVTGIEIKRGTLATSIEEGETYVTSTAVVLVNYSDGKQAEVLASQDTGVTFSQLDTSTIGDKQLTVSYMGAEVVITVTVTAKPLTDAEKLSSITLDEGTVPNKVAVGGTLDTSGAVVRANMADSTFSIVDNSELVFGTISTSAVGQQILTITFTDSHGTVATAKHTVAVVADSTGLEDIDTLVVKAGTLPNVIQYGSTITMPTLVATYGNGIVEEITEGITVNGLDTAKLGEQSITFTYDEVTTELIKVTVSADADQQAKIVKEIAVISGSIVTSIVEGGTLDTSNLKVMVTFLNGIEKTVTVDSLTVGSIDTSVAGVEEKLAISYKGELNTVTIEYAIDITAQDTSEIAESISITAGTLANKVAVDGTLDTSSAVVVVVFEDGHSEDDLTVSFSTIDTFTVGEVKLTVSFTDIYNHTVKCEHIVEIVADGSDLGAVASIAISGLSTKADYASTYSTSSLVVVATYGDGIVETITTGYTVSELDTKTIGEQDVTVTHTASGKTASVTVEVSATAAQKATIATSISVTGLASKVVVGGTLDTTNLSASVKFLDGTTKTIAVGDLTVGTIDASVVGDSTVVISYTDEFGNKVTYTHSYTVKESTIAISQLESQLLNSYTGNLSPDADEEEFADLSDTRLYAGDDNTYHLSLIATDANMANIADIARVAKAITVEWKDGNNWVSTDIAEYVTVDSDKAIFQFAEEAVGKTFRITIKPTETTVDISDIVAEVTVMDGWNVYNATDLSILDNTDVSFSVGLDTGSYTKNWEKWKQENAAEIYDYQFTQGKDVVGIVLQSDIELSRDAFPEEYFWKTNEHGFEYLDGLTGGAGEYGEDIKLEGSLKDALSNWGVYQREVNDGEQFVFQGNFFSVTATSDLRVVAEVDALTTKDVANAEENHLLGHHTGLLHFSADSREITDASTGVMVTNTCFAGNAPNNGKSASSGGVSMIYADTVNFTADNIVSNNFYKSYYFVDHCSAVDSDLLGNFVVKNAKGYGNYNTYLYGWAAQRVTIIDSEFVNCGGPVMYFDEILDRDADKTLTRAWSTNVNIINSTLSTGSSYQKGNEPWYTGSGMDVMVTQLKQATPLLFGAKANQSVLTSVGAEDEVFNCVAVIKITDGYEDGKYGDIVGGYVRIFDTMADYEAYYAEDATIASKANITTGLDYPTVKADANMKTAVYGTIVQGTGGFGNYVCMATSTPTAYGTILANELAGLQADKTGDTGLATAGDYCNLYTARVGLVLELFAKK